MYVCVCACIWHNLHLISIFVKPVLAIPSCENDNTKFFTSRVFSPYCPDFLLAFSFRFRSMKFPSSSVFPSLSLYYLPFEFSFSFNLNNSFGRPLHRISNKIAGTIFVRSSFLIPSLLLAISPRLSVCLRPSTLSPSTFRLIWPRATPELAITASSRLVKAQLISSVYNPHREAGVKKYLALPVPGTIEKSWCS